MVPVGAIAVALFTVALGTAGLTYAYRRRDRAPWSGGVWGDGAASTLRGPSA